MKLPLLVCNITVLLSQRQLQGFAMNKSLNAIIERTVKQQGAKAVRSYEAKRVSSVKVVIQIQKKTM